MITNTLTHHTIAQMVESRNRVAQHKYVDRAIPDRVIAKKHYAQEPRRCWSWPPDFGDLRHNLAVIRCIVYAGVGVAHFCLYREVPNVA